MLTSLKLRDFRCFQTMEEEFAPGTNLIVGPNARGKTSLLEAACVMLRLQSTRSNTLAPLIRLGAVGFVVDGFYDRTHLQLYFSPRRKKLALDSVEQRTANEYLKVGRVVWFSNADMALVRGGAEERRRFFDFVASQLDPSYRKHLKSYEKALRSRNFLLKAPRVRWQEIAAFDEPLVTAGNALTAARERLIVGLRPFAEAAHRAISGEAGEGVALEYVSGAGDDFMESLAITRDDSLRLRQTTVGPHRDDLQLHLNHLPTALMSEGQQRTMVLALRLAQAHLLAKHSGRLPLLLIDDVFGELDLARRNALLAHLPEGAQKIITTTHFNWAETPVDRVITL